VQGVHAVAVTDQAQHGGQLTTQTLIKGADQNAKSGVTVAEL
jgi:hypothetical protein